MEHYVLQWQWQRITMLHPKFSSCSRALCRMSDIFSRRTGTSAGTKLRIKSLSWEPKKLATLSKKNKIMWWQIPRRERGAGGFPSKPTEYLISIYQMWKFSTLTFDFRFWLYTIQNEFYPKKYFLTTDPPRSISRHSMISTVLAVLGQLKRH